MSLASKRIIVSLTTEDPDKAFRLIRSLYEVGCRLFGLRQAQLFGWREWVSILSFSGAPEAKLFVDAHLAGRTPEETTASLRPFLLPQVFAVTISPFSPAPYLEEIQKLAFKHTCLVGQFPDPIILSAIGGGSVELVRARILGHLSQATSFVACSSEERIPLLNQGWFPFVRAGNSLEEARLALAHGCGVTWVIIDQQAFADNPAETWKKLERDSKVGSMS